MLKTIAAAVIAGGLGLTAAAGPALAEMPRMDRWQLAYVDASGNPADLRTAYAMVAFVRGPRNFVLELVCNERNRMAFRLVKRETGREKFTGPEFAPNFTVLSNGREVFNQTFGRDFQYRDNLMAYQGPVRKRLMESLARGDAVVVREEGGALNVRFTLSGSAAVIGALPCGIDD